MSEEHVFTITSFDPLTVELPAIGGKEEMHGKIRVAFPPMQVTVKDLLPGFPELGSIVGDLPGAGVSWEVPEDGEGMTAGDVVGFIMEARETLQQAHSTVQRAVDGYGALL
jgi:hypothetical protein